MDLYKANETNSHKFYQIPKELAENPCYRYALTSDAKLIYALLLDRMELSRKNNWVNDRGEIFLLYTKENIAEILGIAERTVYNSFRLLEACQLIKQERQGLNKPNKIYIGKVNYSFSIASNKGLSRICKICRSGCAKYADQDMQNLQTNYTEFNETDINETESYKGTLSGNKSSCAYSFRDYISIYKTEPEKIEVISYYLGKYKDKRREEHPNLKADQWERVIDSLFYCVDENTGTDFDLDYSSLIDTIDQHFKTRYKNCDYNILHFVSDGVKVRRMYEAAY